MWSSKASDPLAEIRTSKKSVENRLVRAHEVDVCGVGCCAVLSFSVTASLCTQNQLTLLMECGGLFVETGQLFLKHEVCLIWRLSLRHYRPNFYRWL